MRRSAVAITALAMLGLYAMRNAFAASTIAPVYYSEANFQADLTETGALNTSEVYHTSEYVEGYSVEPIDVAPIDFEPGDYGMPSMSVDQLIVEVAEELKPLEGFRGFVYDDKTGQPWETSPKQGNPTIGYGHLLARTDDMSQTMTEPEAYELLLSDVRKHLGPIIPHITVPLSLEQWKALNSLAFNAGPGSVTNGKGVLGRADSGVTVPQAINGGDLGQVYAAWMVFTKGRVTVDGETRFVEMQGLVNRREKEFALFMEDDNPVDLVA